MIEKEKIIISENTQPNFSTNLAKHTITMDLDHYNYLEEYIRRIQDELEQKDNKIKQYENMILEHKKQLHKSGIYGYDYDLELLESEE